MTTASERLSPGAWDVELRADLLSRSTTRTRERAVATGKAVVVGSRAPFAVHAGSEALSAGGSAVDALVATALAQVVCAMGSAVSYAGICTLVHYEAATGEVTALNGNWQSFLDEDDPMSIPAMGVASGRASMVGGFMAALGAAHDRFGKLDWADLFRPAVWVAEQGLPISPYLASVIANREPVLGRSPEGRAIFFDANGALPKSGVTFRQPDVAETLQRVADQGARYLYEGAWAEKFVELVRRAGGKPKLEDLGRYQAMWTAPLTGTFRDFTIATNAAPDHGGAAQIEALGLVDAANLTARFGDPTKSAEALYWLIQIARSGALQGATPVAERADPEHARKLWKRLQAAGKAVGPSPVKTGTNSDFVCAADEAGNLVAACHSINTLHWGTTGIFVDGVSVPDPACFQQPALAAAGPGNRLPSPVNPLIVLRDGEPVLASSSIGSGLHEVTIQCLTHVLALGRGLGDTVAQSFFHGLDRGQGDSETVVKRAISPTPLNPSDVFTQLGSLPTTAVEGDFDSGLLDEVQARGQAIAVKSIGDAELSRGNWAGIRVLRDGNFEAACTGFSGGYAATAQICVRGS